MLILVLNLLTRIKLGRHTWCARHARRLRGWTNGQRSLNFGIPMVWREPTNFVTDCYFCAVDVTGINRKNRDSLKYPDLQSARHPVAHCDEIPVSIFGELPGISDEDASNVEGHEDEEEFILEDDAPHPSSQKELNDLVRYLSLSTDSAELLASRLKGKKAPLWQCLHQLLPEQASRVPPFFLYSEGVLCRYCAASDQAWSATVQTQRLETAHWLQQAITEICSATQRQLVCLCAYRSLDYTEGEVWSGEVCTGENWLWLT